MRPLSHRRVLITGGTGFIGSHLVRDCLSRGDRVVVVTRNADRAWRLDGVRHLVDLVPVDPHDAAEMFRVVAAVAPQRVFHLAAATRMPPRDDLADTDAAMTSNVEPLRHLLDALRRLDTPPTAVVRAGTLAEYGESADVHEPSSPEQPADAYGLSALVGTHLMRLARTRSGIPSVTVRLSLVYGAMQSSDFLIPCAIRQGLAGQPIRLDRPQAQRDLLHVDDVVAALQRVADCAAILPPVLAVSTGAPLTMGEVIAEIARQLHVVPPPLPITCAVDAPRHRLSCRPSAAVLATGWRPRVSLPDGLAQVIASERETLPIFADRSAPCP